MFASCVCLVFLIWGRVLNRSASANEETPADDVNAVRNRTLLTVPSNGANNHSPGAEWDTKIKGTASRTQDAASGSHFLQKKLLEELTDYKFVFPHVLSGKGSRRIATLPQKKLLEELTDYKFVFPHVLSGKGSRRIATLPQRVYPNHISISMELEGEDITLELSRNTLLLPKGFQVSYYDSNGTLVTEKETELYRCSYEGSIRSLPGSQVSASICSGLSALIVFSNRSYIIEHLAGDKHGRHFLYRPEDLPPAVNNCRVRNASPELTLTGHLLHSQRVKRNLKLEPRHLELVLVTDNKLYQHMASDRSAVVRRLINIANTMDLYYKPFNIRIALIGVEVWTTDQIKVDNNAKETMNRFLKWRRLNLLPRMYNDNAHLITTINFAHDLSGLASFGGICSVIKSGGVNSDTKTSFLPVSVTITHELGHNLGMAHDSAARKCVCDDPSGGCIMEAIQRFPLPTKFSSCSVDDFMRSLNIGRGSCLNNLPNLNNLVDGPKCGNMYVEKGEDCDCGIPAVCSDSCCQPLTCKLKPGAKCSSVGRCCKDCKFLPAATPCRPLRGECDLPEFCRGDSSDCPENVYLKDGHTCSNGNLYCSGGTCHSAEKQCQDIWGKGAKDAATLCYSLTNQRGNEYGNCGEDDNHHYKACNDADARCGKIQCKGGRAQPIRGGTVDILNSQFNVGGKTYECRATFSTLPDSSFPDLVQQGTKCGPHKVCYNAKCQDVSVFKVKQCDATCNNKGVCNSKDNCHCDKGWAPPFCSSKGPGGSIDSGPVKGNHSSYF
ncbi:disintegrin and metalloproteinase domain-containing protein 12-like [Scyliorhinus canicula]|uniref:disintegrin and metalloproteinase domain-containing protein 12-like n=1 Tax=Scyliorhinus canicula TaxID=7830 RepID=UPI0018F40368|nr:disintegrin and metalloproteinase domain-containing protein 12-like [Scyliorhinus canicula]